MARARGAYACCVVLLAVAAGAHAAPRDLVLVADDEVSAARGIDAAVGASDGHAAVKEISRGPDGKVQVVIELPETAADQAREQIANEPGVTVAPGGAEGFETYSVGPLDGQPVLDGAPGALWNVHPLSWIDKAGYTPVFSAFGYTEQVQDQDPLAGLQSWTVTYWPTLAPTDCACRFLSEVRADATLPAGSSDGAPMGHYEVAFQVWFPDDSDIGADAVGVWFKTGPTARGAGIWILRDPWQSEVQVIAGTPIGSEDLHVPATDGLAVRLRGTRDPDTNVWESTLEVRDLGGSLLGEELITSDPAAPTIGSEIAVSLQAYTATYVDTPSVTARTVTFDDVVVIARP